MAVDTPVLERPTNERAREYYAHSIFDVNADATHNAGIKDRYAKLINPENKIDDILNRVKKEVELQEQEELNAQVPEVSRPYLVENARADADIFRANSAVNSRTAEFSAVQAEVAMQEMDEEDEELCPTPTTTQYRTIGSNVAEKQTSTHQEKRAFTLGKRERIVIAFVVAFVVALVALIILNSTVISSLNADISQVQDSITTVRGALAGVNSTVEEIINNAMGH